MCPLSVEIPDGIVTRRARRFRRDAVSDGGASSFATEASTFAKATADESADRSRLDLLVFLFRYPGLLPESHPGLWYETPLGFGILYA